MNRQKTINTIYNNMIESDTYKGYIQVLLSLIICMMICFIMFIINIMTQELTLMLITGVMALICSGILIYVLITKKYRVGRNLIFGVFLFAIIIFLVKGLGDGFSPYWILLFPYLAFFLYDFRGGLIRSLFVQVLILLMLWTPLNQFIQYDYGKAFFNRYPVLYFSLMVSSISLGYVQNKTLLRLKGSKLALEKISTIDCLTGLENRRFFDQHSKDVWRAFQNKDAFVGIFIIDVDDFKKYNDRYGHLAGDEVLISIARALKEVVDKENGYISRWGGEEFICLFPDVEKDENLADQLLKAIVELEIRHEDSSVKNNYVTISIGGAIVKPSSSHRIDDVILSADQCLYKAKADGKNCYNSIEIQ